MYAVVTVSALVKDAKPVAHSVHKTYDEAFEAMVTGSPLDAAQRGVISAFGVSPLDGEEIVKAPRGSDEPIQPGEMNVLFGRRA